MKCLPLSVKASLKGGPVFVYLDVEIEYRSILATSVLLLDSGHCVLAIIW